MDVLLPLVQRLISVVKAKDESADAANIQQMALFNLKLLSKLLAHQHPQDFLQVELSG